MTAFVSAATTSQFVPAGAGHAIPITMPSGIAPGDYLVVIMGQYDVNVVNPSIAPTGWTIKGQAPDTWTKIADGSESGTTVNWTSQSTASFTFADDRVWLAVALCYRFAQTPSLITFSGLTRLPTGGATLSSGSIGGLVGGEHLRIFGFVAAGDNGPDQFAPTAAAWTTAVERGELSLQSTATPPTVPGYQSSLLTVADAEHAYAGSVYDPGDSVVITGGPVNTNAFYKTLSFFVPLTVAYWGINATTPT